MLAFTTNYSANPETQIQQTKTRLKNKKGQLKKARVLTFETQINHSAAKVWAAFGSPGFWLTALNPKAVLKPKSDLPERWNLNDTYRFSLFMYRIVPFGNHYIRFESINQKDYSIQTRENGFMVPAWDNYFKIIPLSDSSCLIHDRLEIQSDGVNGIVAAYAIDLFKAKHRRLSSL